MEAAAAVARVNNNIIGQQRLSRLRHRSRVRTMVQIVAEIMAAAAAEVADISAITHRQGGECEVYRDRPDHLIDDSK